MLTRKVVLPTSPDTPVCPNHLGRPMTVNGLQDRVRHYAQAAGVQVTAHQLRHTFARQMVEHDLPVTTLPKLMGHASLSTTQVYLTGADPQVRREYTDAMTRWEQSPAPVEPPSSPPAHAARCR